MGVRTADPLSLLALRRGRVAHAMVAAGLGALVVGYVAPGVAAYRSGRSLYHPLVRLSVPTFQFPPLRAPRVSAAPVAQAVAKAAVPASATGATAVRHHRATRTIRLPIIGNRYVVQPASSKAVDSAATLPLVESTTGGPSPSAIESPLPDASQPAAAAPPTDQPAAEPAATPVQPADPSTVPAATPAQPADPSTVPAATPVPSEAAIADSLDPPATDTIAAPSSTPAATGEVPPPPPSAVAPDAAAAAAAVVPSTPAEPVAAPPEPSAGPSDTATLVDPTAITASTDSAPPLPPVVPSPPALVEPSVAAAEPAPLDGAPIVPVDPATISVPAPDPTGASDGPPPATGDASTPGSDPTVPVAAPIGEAPPTDPLSTGPPRAPPDIVTPATGGTITSADGNASIAFAPASVTNDTRVTITSPGATVDGIQPVSNAYELTAVDTVTGSVVDRFANDPTLTIHYSPLGSAPPSIYFVDATGPVKLDSVVDDAAHTVTAPLPHFSLYVAGATLPGGSPFYSFDILARTGDTISWPDPTTGTTTTKAITALGLAPSVNSSGAVAFTAKFAFGSGTGSSVFLADSAGNVANLTSTLISSTRSFGEAVQINDSGTVVGRDSLSTGSKIRLLNATSITLKATDPDGNPLTYSIASGPTNGALGPIQGNVVVYTPSVDYTGPDSFTYKASDGTQDSTVATVNLTVVGPASTGNHAPVAGTTRYGTVQDTAVTITLSASDQDGNALSYSLLSSPANGSLGAVAGSTVTYTPTAGFYGADSFTFKANDGSLDSSPATVVVSIWPTGLANHRPESSDLAAAFVGGATFTLANGGVAGVGRSAAEYDSVLAFPTINNGGDVAFISLTGNTDYVVTPLPQVPTPVPLPMNQAAATTNTAMRPMIDDQGRVLVRLGVPAWNPRQAYQVGDKVMPTITNLAAAPFIYQAIQVGIGALDPNGNQIFYNKTAGTEPNWATRAPATGNTFVDGEQTCAVASPAPDTTPNFCGVKWQNTGITVPVSPNPLLNPDPIVLFNANLGRDATHLVNETSVDTVIADASMGFKLTAPSADGHQALGRAPAISDDGDAVAFFGELTDPTLCGLCAPNMTPGPGIFVSIVGSNGTRTIVRVTGGMIEDMTAAYGNGDGICNPDELTHNACIRAAELGYDDSGNAVYFSSLDPDVRLGVIHQPLGTGAGDGPKPSFTWAIQPRFGVTDSTTGLIHYVTTAAEVQDQHRTVDFDASGSAPGAYPVVSYEWTMDGAPLSGQHVSYQFATFGDHDVTLKLTDAVGLSTTLTQRITIRDILIASLGDSVASGEGNPDVACSHLLCPDKIPPIVTDYKWEDERCHRSALAGTALAAKKIEDDDPHSTVTFIHLACSGGRIEQINGDGHGGILTPYNGILDPDNLNPALPPLPPQLDQLIALIGTRTPDAVLVSTGANDLKFSKVISDCVANSECWNQAAEFWGLLADLPAKYDELAAALAAVVPADKVYLTQYFNPTRDDNGNYCDGVLGPGFPLGITAAEMSWADRNVVTNLNKYGQDAATRNGWTYVSGIADQFYNHGYCATAHYVDQVSESFQDQNDENGGFHPNHEGQAVYRDAISESLLATIGLNAPAAPGFLTYNARQATDRTLTGDEFVISFIGTPNHAGSTNPITHTPLLFTDQKGLWTVRLDVDREIGGAHNLVFHTESPLKVVQAGDQIGDRWILNQGGSFVSFEDMANATAGRTERAGDHRVVLWAQTCTAPVTPCAPASIGQMVLRGSHLDSDQDGLLDHWETQGLDLNGDGTVDVNLAAMGADENKRDLFLEVDWTAPRNDQFGHWSNAPAPGALQSLVDMFKLAPKLDNGIPAGITVHVDAGPGRSIGMGTATLQGGDVIGMPGDPTKHIDVVYMGKDPVGGQAIDGTAAGLVTRSLDDIKKNYFSTTNSDGRELAFHYLVLADFYDPITDAAGHIFKGTINAAGTNAAGAGTFTTSAAIPSFGDGATVLVTLPSGAGEMVQLHPTAGLPANNYVIYNAWPSVPAAGSTFSVLGGSSGVSEASWYWGTGDKTADKNPIPGNDLLMTLGAFGTLRSNKDIQWRTIAHELGHTLGLRHGGDDFFQYKGGDVDPNTGNPTPAPGKLPGGAVYAGPAYNSLMSYSHQTDLTNSSVTSYSGANDKVFDDWGNLRLDFQNALIHLGNSDGRGLGGTGSDPDGPETLNLVEVLAQNPGYDFTPPTAAVSAPAIVGIGQGFVVTVDVTSTSAIQSVQISFDVNGDGIAGGPGETIDATWTGGTTYTAIFHNVAGAEGSRAVGVDVIDVRGNTAVATADSSVSATAPPDLTAPLIHAVVSPGANAAGWNNSPVTVTWSVDDPESGLAGTSGCGPTSLSGETDGTTLTCGATNGAGIAASVEAVIKIDRTAPTISATRTPANAAGWNNGPVAVSFTCSDGLSGVGSCSSTVTVTTEGINQSAAGTATDQAGNTAGTTVTGINIDTTAPTLTSSRTPDPNGFGWYSSDVTIATTCADGLSGLVSCPADLTVTTEGAAQLITRSAADAAGNIGSTSQTVNLDRGPPTWQVTHSGTDAGGNRFMEVTVQDTLSGLLSIDATTTDNVSVSVQSFLTGATTAVVTVTMIDPAAPVGIVLEAGDEARNFISFSPAFPPSTRTLQFADLNGRPPLVEATVTGTVLTPAGDGVESAVVRGISDTGYSVHTTTAADGSFSVGVSRGLWTFSVDPVSNYQSPGSAQLDTTVAFDPLDFTMVAYGVYLDGVTMDSNGVPIADVQVSNNWGDQTTSAADGRYRLGGGVGSWNVTGADVTGFYPSSIEAYYTTGSHTYFATLGADANHDLVYTQMPRIVSGSLVDQFGDGVVGVPIQASVYSRNWSLYSYEYASSATDGTWAFRVPSDINEVDVYLQSNPPGYADPSPDYMYLAPSSPDDGSNLVAPDVTYRKLLTPVSGVVDDNLGNTIAGVTVQGRWCPSESCYYVSTQSGPDGSFSLYGDAESWLIYTNDGADGYATPDRMYNVSVPEEGLSGLHLTFVAAAVVTGVVTRAYTGEPVAGASFHACDAACWYSSTNSAGGYQAWLPLDRATGSTTSGLIEFDTGIAGFQRPLPNGITASSGDIVTQDFAYRPFATAFSGTGTDSFGAPVEGALVHVRSSSGDEATTTTAADGTWSATGPDGTVSIYGDRLTGYGASGALVFTATAPSYDGNALTFPTAFVAGTVLDSAGAPVGGAAINADHWQEIYTCTYYYYYGYYCYYQDTFAGTLGSATTAADGTYAIRVDPTLFGFRSTLHVVPQPLSGYTVPGYSQVDVSAGATTEVDFVYQLPPPNDDFANAQVITGASGTVTGSNVGATAEPSEPYSTGTSIWYRWTPDSPGRATFDASSSSVYVYLQIYTGATLDALTQVAASTGSVQFIITPGQTYQVKVDSYYSSQSGSVTFTWQTTVLSTITGLVTDDQGAPLAGVRVALDNRGYTVAAATTTDVNGRYTFTLDNPTATSHSVEPYGASGYTKRGASVAGSFYTGTIQNGTTWNVPDLVLDRNGSIAGTASDDTGAPVTGARFFTSYTAPWAHCLAGYETYCTSGYLQYYNAGTFTYEATSDAAGLFSLSAPSGAGIVVKAHQIAQFTTPPDAAGIDVPVGATAATSAAVILYRRTTITGSLLANVGTLPSVRVHFDGYDGFYYSSGQSAEHYYSGDLYVPAGTPTYSIGAPSGPGSYTTVTAPDFVDGYGYTTPTYGYQVYDADLTPGATLAGKDFSWAAFGVVTGHVLDHNGGVLPVAVQVRIDSYDLSGRSHTFFGATAADGSYSMQAQAGTATVYVTTSVSGFGTGGVKGSTSRSASVSVVSGATTSGVDHEYIHWVTVTGTLTADTGALPSCCYPTASYQSRDTWGSTYSGSASAPVGGGVYSVSVAPGTLSFYSFASFSHFLSPATQAVPVPIGASVNGVDFVWRGLGTVTGTLRNEAGEPVGTPAPIYDDYYCRYYNYCTYSYATLTGTDPQAIVSTYVYLDPAAPPSEVMLQFNTSSDGSWEHRAYWGDNLLPWGVDGTVSRLRLGDLPAAGQWVRLDVPAASVGIAGRQVGGIAYSLYDGAVWWDATSLGSPVTGTSTSWVDDAVPAGASTYGDGGDTWTWDTAQVFSGTQSHYSANIAGEHQQYFLYASSPLAIGPTTYSAQVDFNGNFSIDVLPDTYRVDPPRVDPYGLPASQTVTVAAAQTATVGFTYQFVGSIDGVVFDDAAVPQPINGVQVCDERGDCGVSGADGTPGHYSFHAPVGARTIVPQRFVVGYSVADPIGPFEVALNATVHQDLTYVLNGTVTGGVTNDLGDGLAGATISFSYYDPASGAFLYKYTAQASCPCGAATYTLSVPYGAGRSIVADPLPGYGTPAARIVDVVSGQPAPTADFVFNRNGSLSGFLDDRQGRPVAGVTVTVYGPMSGVQTTSDAAGYYTFASLSPGAYDVYPGSKTGYVTPEVQHVTVPSGGAATADFLFVKQATVHVHVQDDLGAPLNGTALVFSGASSLTAHTDASGNFSGFVTPGDYTITPQGYSGGFGGYLTPGSRTFSIAEGDDLTLAVPFEYVREAMLHIPVVDQNGTPLRGSTVYAYEGGVFVGSGTSAFDDMFHEDGIAVIFVPAAASIVLVAQPRAVYDAPTEQMTVSGAPGEHVHLHGSDAFVYFRWGKAEGYVANDLGVGIPGVTVTTSLGGSAVTSATGFFSISTPRGAQTVANNPVTGYVSDSKQVIVVSGETAAVNLTLVRYGRLVGAALDDGGSSVAGVQVEAWLGPSLVTAVTSGLDGSFALSVAPGTYTVIPRDSPSHVAPASVAGLIVMPGADTSVPLGAFTRFGVLDGYVRDSQGNPLRDSLSNPLLVTVTVRAGGTVLASATTDAAGHYSVSVKPGTVSIVGGSAAGFDAPAALGLILVAGVSATADPLVYLHWGRLVGHVRDSAGNPVAGLTIRTSSGRTATTDSSGAFALAAPKGDYVVTVDRHAGVVTPAGAAAATITSETDTPVDFTAEPYRTITGVVQDGAGDAVHADGTGASPTLYVPDNYAGGFRYATLGADGESFSILTPPGAVTLFGAAVAGYTAPSPTPVAAGVTALGAPLVYLKDGILSATLTDDLGPLGNVRVTIVSRSGGGVRYAQSDPVTGGLTVQLPVGSYDISVDPVAEHLRPDTRQSILIGTGVATDVAITVRRFGDLHGLIRDDAGAPIPNATVYAQLTNGTTFSGQTDELGAFTIRGPPTDSVQGQTYRVFVHSLANHEPAADKTGIVLGDAGQANGSVDVGAFEFVRYAELRGQVRDNVGNPLAGVGVHAQQSATLAASTVSAADGSYVLHVKRGSDYRVFGDSTPNEVTPVPDPSPDLPPLTVAAGESVTGLDLVYQRYLPISGFLRDNAGNGLGSPGAGSGPFIGFSGDAPVAGGDVLHINARFKSFTADGAYTAYVPPGNYLVAPMPLPGYVNEGVRQLEVREGGCFLGTDVTVPVDCSAYNWTFTHGVVEGFVRDDAGNPLPAVLLELKGVDYGTATFTDENGHFTLGAPPDDYAIIGMPTSGYTTPLAPTIVHLTASATPVESALVYPRNTDVAVRALDANTGLGLEGITFEIRNSPDGGKDVATGVTGADGRVTISAPSGRITIYPGVERGYELPANQTATAVPGGSLDAGGFLYVSAVVNGVAQDSFGVGLGGVQITAQDQGGFYNDVVTANDGSFSIHLHTGTNFLYFSDRTGYEKPTPLTLANLPAGVSASPVSGVYGNARVIGTVFAAATCPTCTDTPLAGATVFALGSGNAVLATATTDAGGSYVMSVPTGNLALRAGPVAGKTTPLDIVLTGLVKGETRVQTITYSVNGHVTGTVRNDLGDGVDDVHLSIGGVFQATTHDGGQFTIEAPSGPGVTFTLATGFKDGLTRDAPRPGLHLDSGGALTEDFVYTRDGEGQGHIYDSAGNGLAGVFIVAEGPNGTVTYTSSGADGSYTLALPAGSVTLKPLDWAGYQTPAPLALTVGAAEQVFGLDFTFGNAILTGLATDEFGNPLVGVAILIEGPLGSIVHTQAGGAFTAPAAPGTASVRAGLLAGYARPAPYLATGLAVGETTVVPTFVFFHAGTISGKAVDMLGAPIAGVKIFVSAPNNSFTVVTAADGTFTSPAAPGDNTVKGNASFGYQAPADQIVTVQSGLDTGGVVLVYEHGILTGAVTDTNGSPLAGVLVSSSGALQTSTRTSADGTYTLKVGLGDNTVSVEDLDGLNTPDSQALPFFDQPGQVGPADFVYQRYSSVPGSELKLLVEDLDTRAPVAGVTVVVALPGDVQVKKTTGLDGKVKFRVDPGTYVTYVFKDGYRPLTTQATAGVGAGEQLALVKNQQFIVGEVTVKRLTLAEILAAGIDINNPANQNIYVFTARIVFDLTQQAPPPVNITFNGDGEAIGFDGGGGFGGGGGGGGGNCSSDFGCGLDGPDGEQLFVKSLPGPPDKKPFAYFLIPGKARFLKEFFDIHFHVVNTADPEWVLEDSVATLNQMTGLPLAPTAKPQTYAIDLGDIAGGKDQSADWIVRGDAQGDYAPVVHYTATLKPIDAPISMDFKAKNPLHVFGDAAVRMTFDVPPQAIAPFPIACPWQLPNPDPACDSIAKWAPGAASPAELERSAVPFLVRIGLQNVTDVPVYKASVTLFDLAPSEPGIVSSDRMFTAGIGVVGTIAGDMAQRPILMGFGEKLEYDWLQIDPHQTVWATWVLIPPFGAPVNIAESSVEHTGGNADFHATVAIDPALAHGISNEDLGVITRGLGQLDVSDDGGVHLDWSPIQGARTYRIYRTQDRYDWTRERSFLAEV